MKKLILIIFAAFYFYGAFCQSMSARLDSLCRTIYSSHEPGAMIAIRDHDKIIFKKGYGLANLNTKTKIESLTNFNIGSLTKQFTAYSILQLANEKRLSLDDKLIKFFPDFNQHIGNLITIRQLLTHSSGIIDHYGFTDTTRVKHATDRDVLIAIKNIDSSYFISGSHYRYSNTAYCLLALIIEKVTGLAYADYIRKEIFTPLNMTHSSVFKFGRPIYRSARGYTTSRSGPKQFASLDSDQSIFFSTEGDGGIYTSIDDYLKWCDAWRKGNALNRALITKAQSPHFLVDTANKLSYGYGWFISEKGNKKAYHTGSNGGFRAISFLIPARSYQIVIFSNRDDIDLEELAQKINAIAGLADGSFTKIESLVSFAD